MVVRNEVELGQTGLNRIHYSLCKQRKKKTKKSSRKSKKCQTIIIQFSLAKFGVFVKITISFYFCVLLFMQYAFKDTILMLYIYLKKLIHS